MAIRYYDEALAEKIQSWVKDPRLTILKPEESTRFFEMTLDNKLDKTLTLPLISISRDKNIEILNTHKQAKTFDGFSAVKSQSLAIPINVVPILINYQIDIYARHMSEADEYLRNFVFNFINYPKLEIELPYNDLKIRHKSNLHLDSNISDNSDIKEHLFPDQFTRFTLKIMVDDAYLFSTPAMSPTNLEVEGLDVIDRTSGEIVESSNF